MKIVKLKIFSLIIAVIIIVPFVFGTSPRPAPYHKYRVYGYIQRLSGGPKENYIVSFLGRFPYPYPDSNIAIFSIEGSGKSITDTSGYFCLEAVTSLVDSLTISVTAADKPSFVSSKWLIPTVSIPITEEDNYNKPGCNGCTAEPASEIYIKGYLHTFENQMILIPD